MKVLIFILAALGIFAAALAFALCRVSAPISREEEKRELAALAEEYKAKANTSDEKRGEGSSESQDQG